jgi:hypothetical protein
MYRCEVILPRTGEWHVLDECTSPTTRAAYERAMRRAYPILASRTWRVVPSDHRPGRVLFTLSIEL